MRGNLQKVEARIKTETKTKKTWAGRNFYGMNDQKFDLQYT